MLVQTLGPHERPVAYFSSTLDPVTKGTPFCTRAIAAAAEIAEKQTNQDNCPRTSTNCVPHEVQILLKEYVEKTLSPQRVHRYEIILLLANNLKLERCNTLNPATLMPLPSDGEKDNHNCVQLLSETCKPREDLNDQPLDNPDLNLFTDGSYCYEESRRCTGFAVTTEMQVLLVGPFPGTFRCTGSRSNCSYRSCKIWT